VTTLFGQQQHEEARTDEHSRSMPVDYRGVIQSVKELTASNYYEGW
jgi:hypothetical protein